jgi:hypothetical protein
MDVTLFAANRLPDGKVFPPPTDAAGTPAGAAPMPAAAAEFGKALASATSALARQTPAVSSWLTGPDEAQAAKPHVSDFMKRTGVDFLTASELLYGVVGSNVERRDWAVIMAQGDPVTAARQATRALYGDTSTPQRTDARYLDESTTLARQGNFALTEERRRDGTVAMQEVKLVDAQGLLLRSAGQDAASIARNAWLFGFDMAEAKGLMPVAQTVAPLLAAELKSAVEGRMRVAEAGSVMAHPAGMAVDPVVQTPEVEATLQAASNLWPATPASPPTVVAPSAPAAPAAPPVPAEAAPALTSETPPASPPAFSTADVMLWRQAAADAAQSVANSAVDELLTVN